MSCAPVNDSQESWNGRAKNDHEERRKHQQDEGEEHLDGRLASALLGPLPSLDAQLDRLCAQDLRNADAELISLNHGGNEGIQVFHTGSKRQIR